LRLTCAIRREEQLPVYDRLCDVRERAVTMGKIADILFSRGDLDEALRIRREEELPVYDRLGDVRSPGDRCCSRRHSGASASDPKQMDSHSSLMPANRISFGASRMIT
jgi:hypothetical protein